ncbi:hypothetical protein ABK040_002624 [Willaertia magna]
MSTSRALIKSKLEEIQNSKDGEKLLKKTIVVFELPFVIEEQQIKDYFEKATGGISSVELFKASALVFTAAIIQFNKEKGAEKALEIAKHGASIGEFDGVAQTAQDVLQGKKITKSKDDPEGGCKQQ